MAHTLMNKFTRSTDRKSEAKIERLIASAVKCMRDYVIIVNRLGILGVPRDVAEYILQVDYRVKFEEKDGFDSYDISERAIMRSQDKKPTKRRKSPKSLSQK